MYGSESSSDGGWISWFIELEGHEFFVEVSDPVFQAQSCCWLAKSADTVIFV